MVHLNLIFKSIWRERGLFAIWTLSLGIAVTGLLIVDVFRQSLITTLKIEGRSILTADASISTRREFKVDELAKLKTFDAETSATSEILAMSIHGQTSRLASVRFIDANYPLLGELVIEQSGSAKPEHGNNLDQVAAWVAPDLLPLLQVKVGDTIDIGQGHFKISGLVKKDASQTFRFGAMAPRIYLRREALSGSGLLQFGSTYTQNLFLKLKSPVPDLKKRLESDFSDPEVQVTVPEDLEQGSFRILSRLLDFLGLTGLVTLCLGWIGIYYLGRRWLSLEAKQIGILKCLGFADGEVLLHLCLKLALILSLGIIFGGALAWIAAKAALPLFGQALPEEFHLRWSWWNSLLLMFIGPVLGLFLLAPNLRAVTEAGALGLIHDEASLRPKLRDSLYFGAFTFALLSALTLIQARSWKVALIFMAALLGSMIFFSALAYAFIFLSRRFKNVERGWKRNSAIALWNSRRALAVLIISVSALAGLLAELIPTLEKTLVGELKSSTRAERPALFLIDIQDEQLLPLKDDLVKNKIQPHLSSPFIRARVTKVNDENYERAHSGTFSTREEQNDARFRNRGVNLSYRKDLSPFEHITTGKAWSQTSHDPEHAEISVEKGYADRMHMKIGDILTFDVQGLELKATIVSLREVDWDSFEPNFFILFPDGVLNDAPKTWIMTIAKNAQRTPADIQTLIAQNFSNVTSINVDETLDQLAELLTKLSGGLRIASALCLGLGIFVFLMVLLFQLASSGKDRMQMKLLGITNLELTAFNLICYGTLCVYGLLLGTLMSLGVAALLAHFAFDSTLSIDWPQIARVSGLTLSMMVLGLIILSQRLARRDSLEMINAD